MQSLIAINEACFRLGREHGEKKIKSPGVTAEHSEDL